MKDYYTIMQRNTERCYKCGKPAVHWHHVLHGPDKKLSEEYGLMIHICYECHQKVHHVDGAYDREFKEDAQRQFLINTFGRCYL